MSVLVQAPKAKHQRADRVTFWHALCLDLHRARDEDQLWRIYLGAEEANFYTAWGVFKLPFGHLTQIKNCPNESMKEF